MYEFLVTTKLLGEQLVYIDDKDKSAVMQANKEDSWKIGFDNKRKVVYIFRMIITPSGRRMQFLHNFITGKKRVKHIDGNMCNNQRDNLLIAKTKFERLKEIEDKRQKRYEDLQKRLTTHKNNDI
jgi:hypothetical protein